MSAASPGPAAAPTATARGGASADRMVTTVRELASDRYSGRRVGTPGGRAASHWLAGRLREIGAAVTMDGFAVSGVKELHTTPILTYRGRPLVHRREFAEQLTSPDVPTAVEGRLATANAETWRDRWAVVAVADHAVVARAEAEGAAGLLVPRGVDEAGWMPKMIAGRAPGRIPILSVRADLHADMAMHAGDTVTASVPMRVISTTGTNVYGSFAESAPEGLSVLLSAHFDGVGDDPDQRFPAAADNASGVAVVLEVAHLLARSLVPGVGLGVAFLDGEEAGAHGSAHHAPQLPPGTNVVNIDGAAQLSDAAAVEAGGPAEALLAALDQAGRHTGVPLDAGALASDNRRYAAAGLPAIGIGMGVPGYQTPAETPDRVEPRTLLASAELVMTTVRNLMSAVGS